MLFFTQVVAVPQEYNQLHFTSTVQCWGIWPSSLQQTTLYSLLQCIHMTVTLQIKKNTCQAFMKCKVSLEIGNLAVLANKGKVMSDFQPHESEDFLLFIAVVVLNPLIIYLFYFGYLVRCSKHCEGGTFSTICGWPNVLWSPFEFCKFENHNHNKTKLKNNNWKKS